MPEVSSDSATPPRKRPRTTPEPERLAYTIADARIATGLSKTKLYSLIKQGTLRKMKVGGRTLVDAASLRALLASEN